MRLPVPQVNIAGHVSNPATDAVEVEPARVHNPPAPLPPTIAPSLNGAPVRSWDGLAAEALTNVPPLLFQPTAALMQQPDGTFVVAQQYMQLGDSYKTAAARMKTQEQWAGPRGDSYISAFCSGRALLPRQPTDGTTSLLIFLNGWMTHVLPDGEVLNVCGPMTPLDQIPQAGGGRQVWTGDFDTPWGITNDLAYWMPPNPADPIPVYVTDGLNKRVAVAKHLAPGPGHMEIRTWRAGFTEPVSVDTALDGTVYTLDRATRKILADAQDGSRREIVTLPKSAIGLRRTSTGTLVVTEDTEGSARLLEVALDGSLRVIGTPHRVVNGVDQPFNSPWLWSWVDTAGCWGPKDDIFVTSYGSYQVLQRYGLDGSFHGIIPTGSAVNCGALGLTKDPARHYGWPLWGSLHQRLLFTGGGGSFGIAQIGPLQPGQVASLTTTQRNTIARARALLGGTTDPSKPSLTATSGAFGTHFLGGPTTEALDAMPFATAAAYWRAGGRGTTPRPEFTDADIQAIRFGIKAHSLRGRLDAAIDPIETGPPLPPPDTTGPTLTVLGWPSGPTREPLALTVIASEPVKRVELLIDTVERVSDDTAPYSLLYDVTLLEPGEHAASVRAEDLAGNTTVTAPVSVTVAEPPPPPKPTVTLTIRDEAVDYEVIREAR